MARNRGWAARVMLRALPPAVVLGCALFGTADSALAQGREEFRKGIELFEQGKYEDARAELEKVLAANPSADVALEMRNEAGAQVFIEMLGRKGDPIATIARKILELAEKGSEKEQADPEKIKALMEQMFSDDEETSFRAMEQLASQVGPFCVPYMVEHLAERRDNDKRVKAIVLLSKLGPDGTNAVCALLKHKDDFVRQNAAAILGHIRDFKAIPYLKALAEKRGESAHVQKEAVLALKNITGKDASALEPAIVYFHALGERYYQEDPTVMINNFKQWTVWEWKDDKLAYRIVPRYSWNDEMAQECCYLAIDHAQGEGDLDPIYTLLVSVFFQRAVEVNDLLALAEEKAAGGGIDAAEVEALKAAKTKVDALAFLARSRGEAQVAKALRKALRDRRATLAVALIGALKDMRMSETLLPADGANLANYIDEGAPQPKAMDVSPRHIEQPAASGEPVSTQPAPAPAPSAPARAAEQPKKTEEKPAEEPKKEEPQPPPSSGSRRRRVSQATPATGDQLLAEIPYTEPATLRTLDGSGEAFGASLAAALQNDDKRVRYAAAEALVRLAPTKKFANSSKVVENLAAAVGESGSRVVYVIARDPQIRNRLLGYIRQLNHLAVGFANAREALVHARSSPAEDVILIHTQTNAAGETAQLDFTAAQFIEQLNVDYRSAGVPVFVLTPKKDQETNEKAFGEKAKAVIPEDVDPVMLKDKLEALFADAAAKRDPKAQATAVASMAAEALASADPRTSVFDLKAATSALTAAVEVQPDAVRIPALRALGNLHARECVDKVAAIFDNPQNSKEIRCAAAYALGESLRGGSAPQKVYEALKAALKEGDANLYRACAEALGKMGMSRDQTREVLMDNRVD
jgi:hypothetical protein